jgi:hypothetical protein
VWLLCRTCFEMQCAPVTFDDNYGSTLDRTAACKGGGSVVVRITDSCPCVHENAYSNKVVLWGHGPL